MNPARLRAAATALATGLSTALLIYPGDRWIIPVIATLSALGIYAIPSQAQKGTVMTTPDPYAGTRLMGLPVPQDTPKDPGPDGIPPDQDDPAMPDQDEAKLARTLIILNELVEYLRT